MANDDICWLGNQVFNSPANNNVSNAAVPNSLNLTGIDKNNMMKNNNAIHSRNNMQGKKNASSVSPEAIYALPMPQTSTTAQLQVPYTYQPQSTAMQMVPADTMALTAVADTDMAAGLSQLSQQLEGQAVDSTLLTQILSQTQQGPPPSTEVGYIPYYLATNIGKNVRAEFVLGTSQYADKVGRLIEVGINYFVLEDINSRTHIMCDLYSVRFVTILQE